MWIHCFFTERGINDGSEMYIASTIFIASCLKKTYIIIFMVQVNDKLAFGSDDLFSNLSKSF